MAYFISVELQVLNWVDNANVVAHNVREDGHSKKQEECAQPSLSITSGMVVTKTDSWESCESPVCYDDGVLLVLEVYQCSVRGIWVQVEVEVLDEADVLLIRLLFDLC